MGKVIVLGGGAAGLMCALTAAKRGRQVLLLEKSNKIGKKILMSGGGRCNFTNYSIEPENFLSANPHFCKSALKRYTQWDFIQLVEQHGIDYEERKHQQLFCKDSAKQILAMLQSECELAGVAIWSHCEINSITALQSSSDTLHDRYQLKLSKGKSEPKESHTLSCESLVVATGALSIPSLGGSGMGYDIARQFSLKLTERRAGLAPFMFSDSFKAVCERLTGLSTEVEVSCNGQQFSESLLFTHRGISGPAILQISSFWNPGDLISLNLLPGMEADQWLCKVKLTKGKSLLKTVLQQKLSKALVAELQQLWWPTQAETSIAEFTDQQLKTIGRQLNKWLLKPSATEGYRTAEVTLGGVDTDGISSKTMEAIHQPGLFFIGEVLDVSGHLGGFNFQWAWSSGYAAGQYT
ncbi:MAG: aminoacetone oxidase family FAD-binding enzyme [SAR86 cluster bacterium]|uniref:Aminoacetone oxidase family FAD-binding enzyme n=1 Tax=SAR86 cluster bacterium TaxID=2030880 RepID=A0A2A4X924_9GAMM|nr:MAG: aminoacetone oxidase family FAD-binding enzyme [SAR86 cluster bacterium]